MKSYKSIGLVMLALGLLAMLGGFALAGFDIAALDTNGPYTTEEETISPAGITGLDIELGIYNISILPASDDQITVKYTYGQQEHYEIAPTEAGVLRIRLVSEKKWYENIFSLTFGFADPGVTVYLPEQLTLPAVLASDTGTVSAQGIATTSLKISLGTGSAHLADVDSSDISLSANTGTLELSNTVATGSIAAWSGTGTVRLNNVRTDELKLETQTGDVDCGDVLARGVRISTGTGSIVLTRLDAELAELSAHTGGIRGTLAGAQADYSITSSAGAGSNNLPDSSAGGARMLTASTGTGSIEIAFEK